MCVHMLRRGVLSAVVVAAAGRLLQTCNTGKCTNDVHATRMQTNSLCCTASVVELTHARLHIMAGMMSRICPKVTCSHAHRMHEHTYVSIAGFASNLDAMIHASMLRWSHTTSPYYDHAKAQRHTDIASYNHCCRLQAAAQRTVNSSPLPHSSQSWP